MTTATVLALLQGDKRNPTRELSLADTGSSGNIYLRTDGFVHTPGEQVILWTDHSIRRDGQDRIASSRKNSTVRLSYDLTSGSVDHIYNLQAQIYRFLEDAGLFQEEWMGEIIWIKYRWHSDTSLPEPVFGQFSHFLEVLSGDAKWPAIDHTLLVTGNLVDVTADLTCKPAAEGYKQIAGNAIGQTEVHKSFGLFIGESATNKLSNTSFNNSTWDTGWTASSNYLATKLLTDEDNTYSFNHAALLASYTGGDYTFHQSLTLTTDTYYISCKAKKLDGTAPTSSDFVFLVKSSTDVTPTIVEIDNGWYYCYGSFTGSASPLNYGIKVLAGKIIIIDDVMVALSGDIDPVYFCDGGLLGSSFSGTIHASESSRPNGSLKYTLNNGMEFDFTICGWFIPAWSSDDITTEAVLFSYYVDSNNYIFVSLVYYGAVCTTRIYRKNLGFVTANWYSSSISIDQFGYYHLALVYNGDTIKLYINGSVQSTFTGGGNYEFSSGGTFNIGSAYSGADIANGFFDGCRIFDTSLTATQISDLYNNELEIKNTDKLISAPLFLWTKDGDGGIDAVDGVLSSAAKDNWAIIGGVSGDVPAYTEWHLDPVASPSDVIWLGLKSVETPFTPDDTLWLDFDTTADSGNSSGDGYDTDTTSGSGSDYSSFEVSLLDEIDDLRGTYQMLARIYANSNSSDVKPYYRLGSSNPIYFDTVTIAANASFLFRDLGQIIISWPRDIDPYRVRAGVEMYETSAAANTHRVDFIQLLPHPWCRIECEDAGPSFAASDEIIIRDDRAWAIDNSDSDSQLYHYHWRGSPVHVRPYRYNYVFILQGEEGVAYPVSDAVTLSVYVTPRYVLPGGPVA